MLKETPAINGMLVEHLYPQMLWKRAHTLCFFDPLITLYRHTYRCAQSHTRRHVLIQIYHSHAICQAPLSWYCIPDDTQHPHMRGPRSVHPYNNVSQLGMLSPGCPLESHSSPGLYKALIACLDMLWPSVWSNMILRAKTEGNVHC